MYDEKFKECKTLCELHTEYSALRKECVGDDLASWECRRAFNDRREEIRKQYRERCFG